jgi:hypothetical protein
VGVATMFKRGAALGQRLSRGDVEFYCEDSKLF